jgi:hypothetical protein
MQRSNRRRWIVTAALLVVVVYGSTSGLSSPIAAGTGSLVYISTATFNGRPRDGVYVLNLATGKTRVFEAVRYLEGGVSASNTGLIAQLQEQSARDAVLIRLTRLDGSLVNEFVYTERYSFPKGGVRISKDGSVVAFALRSLLDDGKRGDRVVTCETSFKKSCVYFDNLSDPAWLPDNRLLTINYGRQVYVTNTRVDFDDPSSNKVTPIGSPTLLKAEDLDVTLDGQQAVFSSQNRVYALNLKTTVVRQLTSGGLGQFRPMISPNGKVLFYLQQCCQERPGLGGSVATSLRVHGIGLKIDAVTETPYLKFVFRDAAGSPVKASGRYGVTINTLP